MIAHVVLFRPRADLSSTDATAFADAFARSLHVIPTIRRAHVGRRVTTGRAYEQLMGADYPYAAVLEFEDLTGLKAYLEHPAHGELGRRLAASVAEMLVYDFEMDSGAEGVRALLEGRAER